MTTPITPRSMSSLERGYRRLLLAYPVSWRRRRGEEMVSVLMQNASHRSRRHPGLAEAWDLIVNGVGTRARVAARASALRRARQRVALLAIGSAAALSLTCLLLGELPAASAGRQVLTFRTPGVFLTLGVVAYAFWLAAAAALVAGCPRAVRWAAGAAGLTTLSLPAATLWAQVAAPPLFLSVVLTVFAVLASAGSLRTFDLVRGRWATGSVALAACLLAVGLLPGPMMTLDADDRRWLFYRGLGMGLESVSIAAGWVVVAALAGAGFAAVARRPGWGLPVLVVALPWMLLRARFVGARELVYLTDHPQAAIGVLGPLATVVMVVVAMRRRTASMAGAGVDPG